MDEPNRTDVFKEVYCSWENLKKHKSSEVEISRQNIGMREGHSMLHCCLTVPALSL